MSNNYNIDITAKDNTKGTISSVGGGLDGLTAKSNKFKAALGVAGTALAAFGVVKGIQGQIDKFDELAKSARAAGAAGSNEAFQGFQVMKQAMNEAGIDAATFDRAMLQTTSRLKAGTEGQKSFAAVTDKMGDSILTANGELKSGPELLQSMMNALNEGTISTEDFAKVVGGRAGPLIQQQFASINTTAEDMQKTLDDVAANTNIVDVSAAENAELFNDTVGRLKEGMGQLMTDAITPILPVLTTLAQDLLEKLPGIVDSVSTAFENLKPFLSLVGTVLTDVVWPIMQKVFEVLGTIAEAIAPLVDEWLPKMKTGFETAGEKIQDLVDFFVGLIEKIKAIPEEVKKMKEAIVGKMGDMVQGTKDKLNGWKDSVLGIFKKTEDEAVGNSIIPDMVDAIINEFTRMKDVTVDTTQEMHEGITGEMQSGVDDFTKILSNGFDKGKLEMNDFKGFFRSTLTTMIKDAISGSRQINRSMSLGQSLHGSGGGGKKGFFSSVLGGIANSFIPGLGSLFGRASGGPVTGGKSYIVGEQGPELYTPSGNGRISRNGQGGSEGLTVNFNLNAIDSRSGTEFIIEQKRQIVGMINDAYTKRGKQGIY